MIGLEGLRCIAARPFRGEDAYSAGVRIARIAAPLRVGRLGLGVTIAMKRGMT